MINSCNVHGNQVIVVYDGFDCPMCELQKEFESAEEQWTDEEKSLKDDIEELRDENKLLKDENKALQPHPAP